MNKLPAAVGFTERERDGLVWLTADHLAARHAFTARPGGVSEGIFRGLNLGETRGDDPAAVRENWRLLCRALGIAEDRLIYGRQTHGSSARIVTAADAHAPFAPAAWEGDCFVTNEPGLALVIFISDCVPVLLEDPEAGVIAAVHCGWRGTVGGVLQSAVTAMQSLGAVPAHIRAAVGPSIGPCCFETGPEVPRSCQTLLGEAAAAPLCPPEAGAPGKYLVDLPGVCRAHLLQLGLLAENIAVSGICTKCHSDLFWSHRATQGKRGSQICLICLPGKEPPSCASI